MSYQWPKRLLLLLAVLLNGCTATEPSQPAHPPMWEVRDADARLILIGSVHQLPANLNWLDTRVMAALAASDELWLELSPAELARAPALFDHDRQDEPVPTLSQRFDRQTAYTVRRLAEAGGFPPDAIDRSESWALAIAAGRGALTATNFTADNGVERRLIDAFDRRDRPIHGLETVEDQLNAFDQLPAAAQDRMLAATVRRAATAETDAVRLVSAWARSDEAALTDIAAQGLADTPELAEPLVYARNRHWARLLSDRLRHPGTVMVAVGTGHLVGDQSLPMLMQRAGFSVRRLSN